MIKSIEKYDGPVQGHFLRIFIGSIAPIVGMAVFAVPTIGIGKKPWMP